MAAAITSTPTATIGTGTSDTSFFHPLTTIFTPPTSCLNAPFTLFTSTTDLVGFSSAWRDRNETSSDCYPYSFSTYQFYWTFYSPGVCPSGYIKAQTSKVSSETRAWCCPSGFTISGSGIYQFCSSFVGSPTTAISASTTLSNDDLTGLFSVTDAASYIALQWPLSVAWKDSDLSLFTPASAPILTPTTSSSISGSSTAASASATATPTQSSSDFSTGAKIGIGVGAGVAVLLVIIGAILLCLRRRRKPAVDEPAPAYNDVKHHHVMERTPTYELDASPPIKYELDATARPTEMESPSTPTYMHRPGVAF